jgi:hypothetical protein
MKDGAKIGYRRTDRVNEFNRAIFFQKYALTAIEKLILFNLPFLSTKRLILGSIKRSINEFKFNPFLG